MGPVALKLDVLRGDKYRSKKKLPDVSGTLEVAFYSFAAVKLTLHGAKDLRGAGRRGDHPPQASALLLCPGCEVLDARRERRRVNSHSYRTKRAPSSNCPIWDECKVIRVPLDRDIEPAVLKVLHGSGSKDVLGAVQLAHEDLLKPTTEPQTLVLGAVPGAGSPTGDAPAPTGSVTYSLEAPAGMDDFMTRNRELRRMANYPVSDHDRGILCPSSGLNVVEVEIMVLAAQGLAKPYEAFAVVYLDGKMEIGRTKTSPSGRNHVWKPHMRQQFFVPIQVPNDWATRPQPPGTFITVRLVDENMIAADAVLGEVVLPWSALLQPSLKTYQLQDSPELQAIRRANACFPSSYRNQAGAQGSVKLLIRQHQIQILDVFGARGLAAGDSNKSSDPYVQIDCPVLVPDGLRLLTPTRDAELDPQWKHRFIFSRALAVSGRGKTGAAALDKRQRTWRRKVLYLLGMHQGSRTMDVVDTSLSEYGPMVVRAPGKSEAEPVESPASSAARSEGLEEKKEGEEGAPPSSTDLVNSSSDGAAKDWVLNLTVWDRDALGGKTFLGHAKLDLAGLSSPGLQRPGLRSNGVCALPLLDDPKMNRQSLDISGALEVQLRASTPFDLIRSPAFRRRYGVPTSDRTLVVDVRLAQLSAKDLLSADINGKSDPYLEAKGYQVWDNKEERLKKALDLGKTETKRATLFPAWKTSLNLSLPVRATSAEDMLAAVGDVDDLPNAGAGDYHRTGQARGSDIAHEGGSPRGNGEGAAAGRAEGGAEGREGGLDRSAENHSSGSLTEHGAADEEDDESDGEGTPSEAGSSGRGRNAAAAGRARRNRRKPKSTGPAGGSVWLNIKDWDRFSGDDFLGACELTVPELLKIEPLPAGGKALGWKKGDKSGPKTRFEVSLLHGCRTMRLPPPTGTLSADIHVLSRFDICLLEAVNIVGVNMMGHKSDAYAKVRVDGHYMADPENPRKPQKTATKEGTVNPEWYDSSGCLTAQVDVHRVLDMRSPHRGLDIELWDAPMLSGLYHTFLGRVHLPKAELAMLILDPPAEPLVRPLQGSDDVSRGQLSKRKISGHLQFHINTSALPVELLRTFPEAAGLLRSARLQEATPESQRHKRTPHTATHNESIVTSAAPRTPTLDRPLAPEHAPRSPGALPLVANAAPPSSLHQQTHQFQEREVAEFQGTRPVPMAHQDTPSAASAPDVLSAEEELAGAYMEAEQEIRRARERAQEHKSKGRGGAAPAQDHPEKGSSTGEEASGGGPTRRRNSRRGGWRIITMR